MTTLNQFYVCALPVSDRPKHASDVRARLPELRVELRRVAASAAAGRRARPRGPRCAHGRRQQAEEHR